MIYVMVSATELSIQTHGYCDLDRGRSRGIWMDTLDPGSILLALPWVPDNSRLTLASLEVGEKMDRIQVINSIIPRCRLAQS